AARLSAALPAAVGRAVRVRAVPDRAAAVQAADIISCATLSRTPLVEGAWLRPGQHVDLVGAYQPTMRESDDAAVRAAQVFVDTRAGALKEAGDIVQPLQAGEIEEDDVLADLFALCRSEHRGREPGDGQSITLFKSVGAALEDLAAAELAVEHAPV
ncbi:MAG TPA: ornithine cyclodeaminase family protein, partial [Vineibacter terrae]|nr:ornithine cyclodeaminase family protein [Vineibacter terrae]